MLVKPLGLLDYQETWQAMQNFTENRTAHTPDEIWLCQHPPVFTQGRHGKAEHILDPHAIPIIQTDRGGQVTYHGPGQLIVYFLLDLKRRKLGIRELVTHIEHSIIKLLQHFDINAHLMEKAPGVYVDSQKICSIGLRVKQGCTYHGIALNVDMDLTPFTYINPCGYAGLKVTQINDLNPNVKWNEVEKQLLECFLEPSLQ